jgi:hypothetical protein
MFCFQRGLYPNKVADSANCQLTCGKTSPPSARIKNFNLAVAGGRGPFLTQTFSGSCSSKSWDAWDYHYAGIHASMCLYIDLYACTC